MNRKVALWTVSGLVVAVALLGCGTGGTERSTNGSEPVRVEAQGQSYQEPKMKDFKLKIKILEKHCFNTAGCNIKFRLELTHDLDLDPGAQYELTYQVTGGQDEYIGTLVVTGDRYRGSDREYISTGSSSTELGVEILELARY